MQAHRPVPSQEAIIRDIIMSLDVEIPNTMLVLDLLSKLPPVNHRTLQQLFMTASFDMSYDEFQEMISEFYILCAHNAKQDAEKKDITIDDKIQNLKNAYNYLFMSEDISGVKLAQQRGIIRDRMIELNADYAIHHSVEFFKETESGRLQVAFNYACLIIKNYNSCLELLNEQDPRFIKFSKLLCKAYMRFALLVENYFPSKVGLAHACYINASHLLQKIANDESFPVFFAQLQINYALFIYQHRDYIDEDSLAAIKLLNDVIHSLIPAGDDVKHRLKAIAYNNMAVVCTQLEDKAEREELQNLYVASSLEHYNYIKSKTKQDEMVEACLKREPPVLLPARDFDLSISLSRAAKLRLFDDSQQTTAKHNKIAEKLEDLIEDIHLVIEMRTVDLVNENIYTRQLLLGFYFNSLAYLLSRSRLARDYQVALTPLQYKLNLLPYSGTQFESIIAQEIEKLVVIPEHVRGRHVGDGPIDALHAISEAATPYYEDSAPIARMVALLNHVVSMQRLPLSMETRLVATCYALHLFHPLYESLSLNVRGEYENNQHIKQFIRVCYRCSLCCTAGKLPVNDTGLLEDVNKMLPAIAQLACALDEMSNKNICRMQV